MGWEPQEPQESSKQGNDKIQFFFSKVVPAWPQAGQLALCRVPGPEVSWTSSDVVIAKVFGLHLQILRKPRGTVHWPLLGELPRVIMPHG